MSGVITLFPVRDPETCRCARCRALARRFPADPPQLLLPLAWPDAAAVAIDRAVGAA